MLMGLLGAIILSLAVIKIEVVTSSRGMIRSPIEPVKISSPSTGIIDSTILQNNRRVIAGDTLVWMKMDLLNAELDKYRRLILTNMLFLEDIHSIEDQLPPHYTSRYIQSYANHDANRMQLQIELNFLKSEYEIAEDLIFERVIPEYEFEKAKSEYQISLAQYSLMNERYLKELAEAASQYLVENARYEAEIAMINASRQLYFLVAPVSGTIQNSPGLSDGSVIHVNHHLGEISPSGEIVAECYVEPREIPLIYTGMQSHLRIDGFNYRQWGNLESEVADITDDVMVINGKAFYRVTCSVPRNYLTHPGGRKGKLRKGMTFTASFVLHRRSIASLLLDRMDYWLDPVEAPRKE